MKGLWNDNEGDLDLSQTDLERFRIAYPFSKVTVLDDCLMYATKTGYTNTLIIQAQELIEKLKLNLEVKSNERNGLFKDSFIVKNKEA